MKLKKYENTPILKPDPANEWEEKCVHNPAVILEGVHSEADGGF